MTTKQEYELAINTLLGTTIKWSKLSREEITELATLLNNPSDLIRKLSKHAEVPSGQVMAGIWKERGKDLIRNWEFPVLTRILEKISGAEKD